MKRDLKELSNRIYDLLIVGAGIYGAAAAWDATLRGLSVALIDKGDFGGATSSNSLKIVHGGLRYLQQLDLKRMRESIRERRTLMKIAPHLVHPLPCIMPTYGHLMKGKEIMQIAMWMNDLISFDRNKLDDPEKKIPRGRIVSREECLRFLPGFEKTNLNGGAVWYDAQMFNSERLLLSFILSAYEAGASVANYVKATSFIMADHQVKGVKARDLLTNEEIDIQAKIVLNTSGGWTDIILSQLKDSLPKQRFTLSTAMNLIINRKLVSDYAAGVNAQFEYSRPDGKIYRGTRVLFATPWRGYTIVGTYHRPYMGNPDEMCVTEKDIHDFLKEINSAFPGYSIQRKDVTFFHKGFLPMDGVNKKTGEVELTKHYRIYDHKREDGIDGLISVVGVKYTTARDVAERAVNFVFKKLGKKNPGTTSQEKVLTGGTIERFSDFVSKATREMPEGLNNEIMRHLVYNYGSEYQHILEYKKRNPDYGEVLPGSSEVLKAEVIHAVREEMAQKLSDVVLRRTDLGSAACPPDSTLEACARIMGKELGWNKEKIKEEIDEVKAIYSPM